MAQTLAATGCHLVLGPSPEAVLALEAKLRGRPHGSPQTLPLRVLAQMWPLSRPQWLQLREAGMHRHLGAVQEARPNLFPGSAGKREPHRPSAVRIEGDRLQHPCRSDHRRFGSLRGCQARPRGLLRRPRRCGAAVALERAARSSRASTMWKQLQNCPKFEGRRIAVRVRPPHSGRICGRRPWATCASFRPTLRSPEWRVAKLRTVASPAQP
mmetsp:Transcript_694/g.2778  ORF Transcript_694/g.2778 Transcript_694/m.2778 type:complete len:212 (-) Transcript_694:281-916(-)